MDADEVQHQPHTARLDQPEAVKSSGYPGSLHNEQKYTSYALTSTAEVSLPGTDANNTSTVSDIDRTLLMTPGNSAVPGPQPSQDVPSGGLAEQHPQQNERAAAARDTDVDAMVMHPKAPSECMLLC